MYPVRTHLLAWINDQYGNRMNICHRLEFYANNECLAALEGRWLDLHYMVRGASLLVQPARKLLKAENYRVTYDQLGNSPQGYNPEGVSDPVRMS